MLSQVSGPFKDRTQGKDRLAIPPPAYGRSMPRQIILGTYAVEMELDPPMRDQRAPEKRSDFTGLRLN